MSRPNVIEKTTATKINWLEGMDPSRKKVKKKRKGKYICKLNFIAMILFFFSNSKHENSRPRRRK